MYHYAANNPVKYTDPDGEVAHVVIGAAIGAGLGAISAWAAGGSGRDIFAAAVGGAVSGGLATATCGASLGTQIWGSALANATGYMTEHVISGKPATVEGFIISAADGATGAMAGACLEKVMAIGSAQLSKAVKSTQSVGGKTYQTYIKINPVTGEVYCGRTSGYGSPKENVRARDANHHMNKKGFGEAIFDKTSSNPAAIRGREQQLIEMYGGAKSTGGTSGNAINGISPKNPKRDYYINQAIKEFN